MFELVDSLCQRYYSLNPFIIWSMPCGKVFKLIRRIQRSNNYEGTNTNAQTFTNNNSPQRINVTGKRGTGGWI